MAQKENTPISDLDEDDSLWSLSYSSDTPPSIVFPSEVSRDLFSIEDDESTQNESEWVPDQRFECNTSRSKHRELCLATPSVLDASFSILTPTHTA